VAGEKVQPQRREERVQNNATDHFEKKTKDGRRRVPATAKEAAKQRREREAASQRQRLKKKAKQPSEERFESSSPAVTIDHTYH